MSNLPRNIRVRQIVCTAPARKAFGKPPKKGKMISEIIHVAYDKHKTIAYHIHHAKHIFAQLHGFYAFKVKGMDMGFVSVYIA